MARIRQRGDNESITRNSFVSDPAASKEMLRILTSPYANSPKFICSTVDISQAVIQADELEDKDRSIAIAPGIIYIYIYIYIWTVSNGEG